MPTPLVISNEKFQMLTPSMPNFQNSVPYCLKKRNIKGISLAADVMLRPSQVSFPLCQVPIYTPGEKHSGHESGT
jgi:hypothetical protein